MKNHQTQTIRQLRPASTTDVLPPVQRYAPACRTEISNDSDSRITHPSSVALLAKEDHESRLEPAGQNPPSATEQPTRASKPKSRNGKIARLPHPVRDMINRMLRNNIPHSKISDALTEHGVTATPRNISNWKTRGGYREWCDQQDRALETRLLQDNLVEHLRTTDATQLSEVGLQLAATQLSQFFLKSDVREQLTADPEKFSTTINVLCRLTRQLHRLQKYRDDSARELGPKHAPERLKREVEKDLEATRHIYSAEKLGQTIHDYDIPHRNFISKNPRAYLSLEDSDQNSDRSPADPLTFLSTLVSGLKNGPPGKPAASSNPIPAL
jgi:hypothetical protein